MSGGRGDSGGGGDLRRHSGMAATFRRRFMVDGGHPATACARGAVVLKASRPLIRVLVINDNHYGLTFLFEL
jgi:hypothetical protein